MIATTRGFASSALCLLLLSVAFAGCNTVKRLRSTGGMRIVLPDVAFAMLRDSSDLVVLDVRETAEFEAPAGHLRGARNLPLSSLERQLATLAPFRDTTLLVYCRGEDGCGEEAVTRLVAAGFRSSIVLDGGFEGWLGAGYGVLSAAGPPRGDPTRGLRPVSHWVELATARRVAGDPQESSGLYVAGRAAGDRFRPRGGVEGSGAFCRSWEVMSGDRTRRGWLELSSGQFVDESEGRSPARPWVRGCLGSDGNFRPDSRDVTP